MSAWIKVNQTLIDHEKTLTFADELHIKEEILVVGFLIALWAWAIDHHPSGILPDSDRIIARACRWPHEPDVFVGALIKSQFIKIVDGKRTISNWNLYTAEFLQKREANKLRQRNWRKNNLSSPVTRDRALRNA